MKLKLDENLPLGLKSILEDFGHEVHTVQEEHLSGAADSRIWESAQMESSLFVTQDMDFPDVRKFLPGTHPGILLIRVHTPSWRRLVNRIIEIFPTEDVSDWAGCFVVAAETKIRVIKPPKT
jgi:predicted nuclease of predicted toxin-antitoxin system